MQRSESPDETYTESWSDGRGEVRFFTRPDGSRLRYYTAGTGPALDDSIQLKPMSQALFPT